MNSPNTPNGNIYEGPEVIWYFAFSIFFNKIKKAETYWAARKERQKGRQWPNHPGIYGRNVFYPRSHR